MMAFHKGCYLYEITCISMQDEHVDVMPPMYFACNENTGATDGLFVRVKRHILP